MSLSLLVLFAGSLNAQRLYNYYEPVDINENFAFILSDIDESYFEGKVYHFQIFENEDMVEELSLFVTVENTDQGTSSMIRRRFDETYLYGYRINVGTYTRSVNNTYFFAKERLSRGQHERYVDGTFYSLPEVLEGIMKIYIQENYVENGT